MARYERRWPDIITVPSCYNAGFWAGYHAGNRPGGPTVRGYSPRRHRTQVERVGGHQHSRLAGPPHSGEQTIDQTAQGRRTICTTGPRMPEGTPPRPTGQPSGLDSGEGTANNVYTDRNEMLPPDEQGWEQRQGNSWETVGEQRFPTDSTAIHDGRPQQSRPSTSTSSLDRTPKRGSEARKHPELSTKCARSGGGGRRR